MLDALSKGETVGKRIAYYRKKKQLSQQQLADLAGVSVCTIKRIENDKTVNNSVSIIKIIQSLQIDQELVFDDYYTFIMDNYSQWLKDYRHKNKLTQKQLSELLHIHIKLVMRWEQKKLIPSRKYYHLIKQLK